MQKRFGIGRQVGMDNEFQAGQVDTAGGYVGGHANAGAAVTHGLQGMCALVLGQFAGESHDGEASIVQAGRQVVHRGAGGAEHNGVAGFVKAQRVDDGVLAIGRRHQKRAIFDIDMLLLFGSGGNAHGVLLVAFGQLGDAARHGGREHQRAAIVGRFFQNEFQIFAEAEIEHLVGLVKHHGADRRQIECIALDMVAQATRRADDDMGAALQRPALVADIHAADAGCDGDTGEFIKPFQLALDLHGQFAGGCDCQRQRCGSLTEACIFRQQRGRKRYAEGNRLAGAGLRGNQRVLVGKFGRKHGLLYGGQVFVAAFFQRLRDRRGDTLGVCHLPSFGYEAARIRPKPIGPNVSGAADTGHFGHLAGCIAALILRIGPFVQCTAVRSFTGFYPVNGSAVSSSVLKAA
ncbi:hypothetical protein AGR8A_Lc10710 [Agrobacterium fabrum str. J-07]|nr:hypothetical protein AGR8A_Lc10710 [Agrobacterium fabrum str. J-07]